MNELLCSISVEFIVLQNHNNNCGITGKKMLNLHTYMRAQRRRHRPLNDEKNSACEARIEKRHLIKW